MGNHHTGTLAAKSSKRIETPATVVSISPTAARISAVVSIGYLSFWARRSTAASRDLGFVTFLPRLIVSNFHVSTPFDEAIQKSTPALPHPSASASRFGEAPQDTLHLYPTTGICQG